MILINIIIIYTEYVVTIAYCFIIAILQYTKVKIASNYLITFLFGQFQFMQCNLII